VGKRDEAFQGVGGHGGVTKTPWVTRSEHRKMRRIAVSLTKGGVAKTTSAVNSAAGLALAGQRVLLIDTDTRGQTGFMLGVNFKRNSCDKETSGSR